MADQEHLSLYNQAHNNTEAWADVDQVTVAEYVWIDGTGITLRSKCRTIPGEVRSLADLPEWNYDGSSCF